ncbi:hypothetical protein BK658_14360 [Pseudomonas brassicacearum]|uniref:Uncharacterized protein n=1 Tax=Pseudomonas brassicacearum TaxID=930166 RepID=A0A423GR45_9PSED|nr:hypothetical protein BK658_14360 [Pseudomonas brassicacearum]
MIQVGLILGTVDPGLLRSMWGPLLSGLFVTGLYGVCLMLPRSTGTGNSLSKCVVAWVSGGRPFATYVIPGQVLMTAAMWAGTLLH